MAEKQVKCSKCGFMWHADPNSVNKIDNKMYCVQCYEQNKSSVKKITKPNKPIEQELKELELKKKKLQLEKEINELSQNNKPASSFKKEKPKRTLSDPLGIGKAKSLFLLVFIFSLVFYIGALNQNDYPSSNEKTLSIDEIKSSAITVSYDNLMRHNANYIGKIVHYKGKILQVTEVYGNNYILRVATKESSYVGYMDDVIWLDYTGNRLLEDDIIEFWGESKGLTTYTAILGNSITVPEVDALAITLYE